MRRAPCFAGALGAVALNAQGQVQRLAEAAGQHRRLQSRPLAPTPDTLPLVVSLTPPPFRTLPLQFFFPLSFQKITALDSAQATERTHRDKTKAGQAQKKVPRHDKHTELVRVQTRLVGENLCLHDLFLLADRAMIFQRKL